MSDEIQWKPPGPGAYAPYRESKCAHLAVATGFRPASLFVGARLVTRIFRAVNKKGRLLEPPKRGVDQNSEHLFAGHFQGQELLVAVAHDQYRNRLTFRQRFDDFSKRFGVTHLFMVKLQNYVARIDAC